jgi:hypothetical protein
MSNHLVENAGMIQTLNYKVGDVVRVHHCYGEYMLPQGLPDGAEVWVVGFVQALRLVEWDGELFEVHMTNIEPMAGA